MWFFGISYIFVTVFKAILMTKVLSKVSISRQNGSPFDVFTCLIFASVTQIPDKTFDLNECKNVCLLSRVDNKRNPQIFQQKSTF